MSQLKAFLQPTITGNTKEVIVSERFKDEKGNVVPFVVKSISQEENETLSRMSTKKKTGEIDSVLLTKRLILECTVQPNFKETEICEYYKTNDPLEVPSRMLGVGEYQILSNAILEINGMIDAKEKIEEAKNS